MLLCIYYKGCTNDIFGGRHMVEDRKTIGNYLVRQSNQLIEASYSLTINENKLIRLVASMIKPEDKEFKEYEFRIQDIIKLFGVKDQHKYIEIPQITKNLMKKIFTIQQGNTYTQLSWFCSTKYRTGEGIVSFKFAPELQSYLLELTSNYTQYQLKNVLRFKSTYSFRFYELLKQLENLNEENRTFLVDDLRFYLGLDKKVYNQYGDFKKRVIIPAQKELIEKTDIVFDFEEIKTQKKITKLRIFVKFNPINHEEVIPIISNEDKIACSLIERFRIKYKSELNFARVMDMIEKKGIEMVNYYFDNLDQFIKNDKNIAGLFYKATMGEYSVSNKKSNPIQNQVAISSIHNFDEREYKDDNFYEQFYANVK